jgi:hypothetical protein
MRLNIIYFMFGKNEILHRRVLLGRYRNKDIGNPHRINRSKNNHLKVGEKSENNNLPHPEASRVIITRSAQNYDLILDYFQDDNRLAQEIISGHTIASVSVEFQIGQ